MTSPSARPGQAYRFADLLRARNREELAKSDRTRLALQIATYECLQDTALEQLRVADICKRAGVSYGLFYHYFPDRYAITLELLREFIDDIFARYMEIHQTGDRYYDIFVANHFYVDTYRLNSGLMRIILSAPDQLHEITSYHSEILSKWHVRLARAIEGEFGGSAPDERKRLLISFTIGGMIDEILRQIFVVGNKFVTKSYASTFELTETISILWHRAVYGRDPTANAVERVRKEFRIERTKKVTAKRGR